MSITFGNGGNIPPDIFSFILTKLPPKDLLQAASVCNCWRDHILSDSFQNLYLKFCEVKYRNLLPKDLIRFSHIERLSNTIRHVQSLINASELSLKTRKDLVKEKGHYSPFNEALYCSSQYDERIEFEKASFVFWVHFQEHHVNENNYDINARVYPNEETPLFYMAISGKWQQCQTLIKRGARIDVSNKNKETPLMFAIKSNSRETVEVILNAGAQINDNDISVAIRECRYEIATFLLEHVESVSKVSIPLLYLLKKNKDDLVLSLIKKGANNDEIKNDVTLLHIACERNNLDLTQAIVEAGADIHAISERNNTALSIAVRLALIDMVKLLIPLGAQPDQRCYKLAWRIWPGLVPLHTWLGNDFDHKYVYSDKLLHAASCGDLNYIKKDSNRWKIREMYYALYVAASYGQLEVVQDCIDHVEIDYNPVQGRTALMFAVMNRQVAAAKLLLEYGANPDLLDKFGMSAKDYAKKYWPDNDALNHLLNNPITKKERPLRYKYRRCLQGAKLIGIIGIGIGILSLALWNYKKMNLKK
jgi:ankyrin repeat protein